MVYKIEFCKEVCLITGGIGKCQDWKVSESIFCPFWKNFFLTFVIQTMA